MGKPFGRYSPLHPLVMKKYVEDYNKHLAAFRAHLNGVDPELGPPGDSSEDEEANDWTPDEKDAFFHALRCFSRHRPDCIAEAMGTRSEAEVALYLSLLDDGAKLHAEDWGRDEIPQAREVTQPWVRFEEKLTSHLLGQQEREWRIKRRREMDAFGKEYDATQNGKRKREDNVGHRKLKRRKTEEGPSLYYHGSMFVHVFGNYIRALEDPLYEGYLGGDEDDDFPQIDPYMDMRDVTTEYLKSLPTRQRVRLESHMKDRQALMEDGEADHRVGFRMAERDVESLQPPARTWTKQLTAGGLDVLAYKAEGLDLFQPTHLKQLMHFYFRAFVDMNRNAPDMAEASKPIYIGHSVLVLLRAQVEAYLTDLIHRVIVTVEQNMIAHTTSDGQRKYIRRTDVRRVLQEDGQQPDVIQWFEDLPKRLNLKVDSEGFPDWVPDEPYDRGRQRYLLDLKLPKRKDPLFMLPERPPSPSDSDYNDYLLSPSSTLISEELHSEDEVEELDVQKDIYYEKHIVKRVAMNAHGRVRKNPVKSKSKRQAKYKSREFLTDTEEDEEEEEEEEEPEQLEQPQPEAGPSGDQDEPGEPDKIDGDDEAGEIEGDEEEDYEDETTESSEYDDNQNWEAQDESWEEFSSSEEKEDDKDEGMEEAGITGAASHHPSDEDENMDKDDALANPHQTTAAASDEDVQSDFDPLFDDPDDFHPLFDEPRDTPAETQGRLPSSPGGRKPESDNEDDDADDERPPARPSPRAGDQDEPLFRKDSSEENEENEPRPEPAEPARETAQQQVIELLDSDDEVQEIPSMPHAAAPSAADSLVPPPPPARPRPRPRPIPPFYATVTYGYEAQWPPTPARLQTPPPPPPLPSPSDAGLRYNNDGYALRDRDGNGEPPVTPGGRREGQREGREEGEVEGTIEEERETEEVGQIEEEGEIEEGETHDA